MQGGPPASSKDIRRYLFTLPDARARDEATVGLAVFIDFLKNQNIFYAADNPARGFLPGAAA